MSKASNTGSSPGSHTCPLPTPSYQPVSNQLDRLPAATLTVTTSLLVMAYYNAKAAGHMRKLKQQQDEDERLKEPHYCPLSRLLQFGSVPFFLPLPISPTTAPLPTILKQTWMPTAYLQLITFKEFQPSLRISGFRPLG